jgi:muramidase (phage lysozyme)
VALAIGCVFNSPALALEPKLMPIKKFILQPREYAKTLVSGKQFSCLDHLWRIESHWNYKAKNPTSTAFGIPQFLNQTWIDYNYPIRPKNPIVQVQAGIHYIKVRYQTPCAALTFHLKHGYY